MFTVSIDLLRPSPNPIRKSWDEDKMQELAASIKERGVIVPIKVRPAGDEYEVVYGHRRVEASRRAGLTEVPAIIESADDTDALIEALIENVQREDMNPLDEALALRALMDVTGWNSYDVERHGIMNNRQVSVRLAILDEVPEVQSLIGLAQPGPRLPDDQAIGIRHIIEVKGTGLPQEDRTRVLLKAAGENLTRHETRAVADAYKAAPTPELKDAVLNTSGKLGDANRILQVAEMQVGVEGITREREYLKQRAVEEWDHSVKEFLDMFKLFDRSISRTITAAEYDKFSPEAKAFTVRKIDGLIANLTSLREVLSNE